MNSSPSETSPHVRAMRTGQHLLAGLLLVVGVLRAIGMGDGTVPALTAGVAFTAAYWYPVLARRPERLTTRPWLGLITVVWAGTLLASDEFTWLAFLLWLIAGQVFSLLGASIYSVTVFGIVVAAPFAHSGATTYAGVIGPFVGAVFALAVSRGYLALLKDSEYRRDLLIALEAANTDMAALQDELALTGRHAGEVAERTRLAREIHDTIAQDLSSIRLLSRAALESDRDSRQTLEQVERIAARASREVREIIASLTPTELEDQALPAAITRLGERFHGDLDVTVRVEEIPALPSENEVALLRTCQSALSNVLRHADASRVTVTLSGVGDTVRLDVRDDGIGFEPGSAQGYGLRFMRERLRELGGGLDVESAPGAGTALSAYVPVSRLSP